MVEALSRPVASVRWDVLAQAPATLARGEVLEGLHPHGLVIPIGSTVITLAAETGERAGPTVALDPALPFILTPQLVALLAVRVGGPVLFLDADGLREASVRDPAVPDAVARARDLLLAKMMQHAACIVAHDASARLANLLLELDAFTPGEPLPLTQAELAEMLALPRTTVSTTVAEWARAGLLDQHRGSLLVLDQAGLGERTCGCREALRDHRERVLGDADHAYVEKPTDVAVTKS